MESQMQLFLNVAILQRSAHEFHFILMTSDLCKKTSACPYNRNCNYREFLYGWVGRTGNPVYGFIRKRFLIKRHKVIHVLNGMSLLGKPCRKYHILSCFLNGITIQNLCLKSIGLFLRKRLIFVSA